MASIVACDGAACDGAVCDGAANDGGVFVGDEMFDSFVRTLRSSLRCLLHIAMLNWAALLILLVT